MLIRQFLAPSLQRRLGGIVVARLGLRVRPASSLSESANRSAGIAKSRPPQAQIAFWRPPKPAGAENKTLVSPTAF